MAISTLRSINHDNGSLPIGIYFDYNDDGKIDSDMAMKFAGDIPLIGGLLKSAYKPVISQNLYSIFVHESAANAK